MNELEDKIDKIVFAISEPYREHTAIAYYLKDDSNAYVKILHNNEVVRRFLFPAYKIWNIAAHFNDIVDSEIDRNTDGYAAAASTGFGGSVAVKELSE